MSDWIRRWSSGAVTLALAGIVVWGLVTGEPSDIDRVQALGSRIKCPVCQGESIADSPSPYAADILTFVEERVDDGWTDDEIITYLEGRFAGIRLDPPRSGTTLLLWLLPVVALGAGIVVALRRTRPVDRTAP